MSDQKSPPHAYDEPNALDLLFKHPLTGPVVLVAVFAVAFQIIFTASDPVASLIDVGISSLANYVENSMDSGPFRSLLVDGIVRGVGSLCMYSAHLILIFLLVAALEKAAYFGDLDWFFAKQDAHRLDGEFSIEPAQEAELANANAKALSRKSVLANMLDRIFSGRLRLGVATLAVAAVVPEQRLVAGFISLQGLVMAVLFLVGILLALSVRGVLGDLLKTQRAEVESDGYARYDLPSPFAMVQEDAWIFVFRTGRLMLSLMVLFWAAGYYPRSDEALDKTLIAQRQQIVSDIVSRDVGSAATVAERVSEELAAVDLEISRQRLQASYLAKWSKSLQSVSEQFGWDWRLTSSAVFALPVPHTYVANLTTVGNLGQRGPSMRSTVSDATWLGTNKRVLSLPVAISAIVFLIVWAPTGSTVAMLFSRKCGTWAIAVLVAMTLISLGAAWMTQTILIEALPG